MKIIITKGSGEGVTSLAALDAALRNAGIGDFNLIQLSSIIPYKAELIVENFTPRIEDLGSKLYVVFAHQFATVPETSAWAGLAWTQSLETGFGLFVEYGDFSKENLCSYLHDSLKSMKQERKMEFDNEGYEIESIKCTILPVCAVVVAIYSLEKWS